MHFLKLIFFCLSLFVCNLANAETYYVNTEVLNLRSCEGTDCKILGKLTSGESVELLEDKGEWVKVKTDIVNFITDEINKAQERKKEANIKRREKQKQAKAAAVQKTIEAAKDLIETQIAAVLKEENTPRYMQI